MTPVCQKFALIVRILLGVDCVFQFVSVRVHCDHFFWFSRGYIVSAPRVSNWVHCVSSIDFALLYWLCTDRNQNSSSYWYFLSSPLANENLVDVIKQHKTRASIILIFLVNSYSASRNNWCTVGGDGGCRVGEVRAGTTSPMPDHKGFKLQ